MTHQRNLVELCDIYCDVIEKQNDLIRELAALAKRQAYELHQLKQMDEEELRNQIRTIEQIEGNN